MVKRSNVLDRYLYSSALYDKPFEPGEPGADKIFITGRVERNESEKKGTIHIEDWMPTYVLKRDSPRSRSVSSNGSQ
jgi:hypothetical protein